MPTDLLIRNVRPPHADATDLLVRDGRIADIGPGLSADDAQVIDGEGRLLFPGFVDAHAHMDKTLLGLGWYHNEVPQNLRGMIDNERELRLVFGFSPGRWALERLALKMPDPPGANLERLGVGRKPASR